MKKKSITLEKLSEKRDGKVLFIVNAVMVYALIYYVAYQVPFHSDDYSYYQMGLSLDAHIKHYIGWSGRFITDYTASFLLNCFKKPIYMAVNSFVLLVVTIIISLLPIIVRREKITRGSTIIFWIVFMLYWVSNPNLGQTSFWLVGSANYLWTLMWASIYFAFFLYLLVKDSIPSVGQYIVLFLMGVFAGLSNEALGISVVLFTVIMFPLFWKEKKHCLIVGLISSGIGYAFLFFSPGNNARLNIEGAEWKELSVVNKFLLHVFCRMPRALVRFYMVYLILILMLIAVLYRGKSKKIDIRSYTFPLIYTVLAICSLFVFVVSPTMPPRSGNSSLFFFLLTISFVAYNLIDAKNKEGIISLSALALVCGIHFIFTYAFVSYSYVQTKTQAAIRESVIQEAKANGNDTAIIPDWFFTRLVKDADKFDMFRSGAMPSYYGLNNIEYKDIAFNYAIIENTKPISIKEQLKDGLTLNNMYVKFNSPFEQTIAFEFDNSLMNFVQEGDTTLYMHLNIDGREEFINADLNLNDFVQMGDKFYYGTTILTPHIDKLSSIDYGFYNSDANTCTASYSLDFKKYYKIR